MEKPLNALRKLAEQVESSNARDDHGHPLKKLKALRDARRRNLRAAKSHLCGRRWRGEGQVAWAGTYPIWMAFNGLRG
jgi:hypothetical protein